MPRFGPWAGGAGLAAQWTWHSVEAGLWPCMGPSRQSPVHAAKAPDGPTNRIGCRQWLDAVRALAD